MRAQHAITDESGNAYFRNPSRARPGGGAQTRWTSWLQHGGNKVASPVFNLAFALSKLLPPCGECRRDLDLDRELGHEGFDPGAKCSYFEIR